MIMIIINNNNNNNNNIIIGKAPARPGPEASGPQGEKT